MIFRDSKTFRYRYEYDTMLLKDFILDRYRGGQNSNWIESVYPKRVRVNGKEVFDNTNVQNGDIIEYLHCRSDEDDLNFQPSIIYEDESILAISKKDTVPVSPSGRYYFNSMAIRVKEFRQTEDISPLHRLDLETSGVLLFGKNRKIRGKLQPLFEKKVNKLYQALAFSPITTDIIEGNIVPDPNSQIYTKLKLVPSENPNSITHIDKQEPFRNYSRLWIRPVTGKTNQIRVHLAAMGSPIVGDKKYYPDEKIYLDWIENRDIQRIIHKLKLPRQALHCESISFFHPVLKKEIEIRDTSDFWENKINSI